MIELKNYQVEAITNLKDTFERLLRSSETEICIFRAPTGSGKTIMVSELLKKLVKDRRDDRRFSFIWISVRMLHEQSKEKLEKYYEGDRLLQCSYFEDLEDRRIGENEILFINWHSINKKDINIYVRENEQDNNLNSIIQNTKEEGREIILVIDESHHTASSEKSKELIEVISPKVTLEVSATPHLKENASGLVNVHLSEVKAEEMIKSEIAVNPEFMAIKLGSESSDKLVIDQALKKRKELANLYVKGGSNINPLVLVQLPDQKSDLVNKKDDVLRILRDKFNITEENGKLAVWLSEEKTETLLNVDKKDSEVDVLVFKQAPALGWDCPRASILVVFRESRSFIFTIQTIGRIMRMPELKYYKESELNKGFVYTNLARIEITEDYAKDYVTIYEGKRDNRLYKDIALYSIYLKRQRERTRLSGEFTKIFSDVADDMNLEKKITPSPSKVVNPIIADGRIVDIDKPGEVEHKGILEVQLDDAELQQRFDNFISQSCSPYAPIDSSDRMKTAIYRFFNQRFRMQKFDTKIQRIVLGKENIDLFVRAISLSKVKYDHDVVRQLSEKRELEEVQKWEVPAIVNYNSRYTKMEQVKSIIKPYYTKLPSQPERLFVELLDNSNKVKWWFRNGESEIKYFAVKYQDEFGFERSFYVDFVVQLEDSSVGLFDTKGGFTAKDAKARAEHLQRYIKEQNSRGKNLWGGITINVNGIWRYNDDEVYSYNEKDLTKWRLLEL